MEKVYAPCLHNLCDVAHEHICVLLNMVFGAMVVSFLFARLNHESGFETI